MDMKNNIFDIADYFLSKESMTHKKLQKLCYYAISWGYALYDEAIVVNPEFQAWIHGPVSPQLYNKYKEYGYDDIPMKNNNIKFDEYKENLLQEVWGKYGNRCGDELEALTHLELPWIEARIGKAEDEPSNQQISVETIKKYYRKMNEVNQKSLI